MTISHEVNAILAKQWSEMTLNDRDRALLHLITLNLALLDAMATRLETLENQVGYNGVSPMEGQEHD